MSCRHRFPLELKPTLLFWLNARVETPASLRLISTNTVGVKTPTCQSCPFKTSA
jgi:hypothetical protein